MAEYRADVIAHKSIIVQADSEEEAVEKLNDALGDVDYGDMMSPAVQQVFTHPEEWSAAEAREKGVDARGE